MNDVCGCEVDIGAEDPRSNNILNFNYLYMSL